ncbi:DUF3179 domain-containing protein [Salinirubellus salinus]|uniref:DUF3179 domain-containing protein n=1 Tax=Salinirubellus salinus TaxID=1364945 RepID=A0A9E7R4J1_9EURY|nr:DUF3179 domain-containing protein [Salinirubellus salinus]UWM55730.1 DUF3179 domain-containing protein [Salinirubellus salinus]
MRRRQLLGGLTVGAAGLIAGCVVDYTPESGAGVDDHAGSAVAYDRRVDGETLSFTRAEGDASVPRAGGSRWAIGSGRALDGPHEGTRLVQANRSPPMFFFAWLAFHPETRVWGRERRT